jgi:hypothetical protein
MILDTKTGRRKCGHPGFSKHPGAAEGYSSSEIAAEA